MKTLEARSARPLGLRPWEVTPDSSLAEPGSLGGLAAAIGRYWLLLAAGIFLGMGYLWFQSRVVEAGWRIRELEQRESRLLSRRTALRVERSRLESSAAIKARMEEFGIELAPPRSDQVVRVARPAAIGEAAPAASYSVRPGETAFLAIVR